MPARNPLRRAAERGFTLVEIAIVMVVIGLLIGAIFVGQELILQARVKSVIADYSGVSVAFHGYRDRYGAMPGDDSRAASRWPPPVATDGNGDGSVAGTYNNGNAACVVGVESCSWWDHLRRGGFIAGAGAAQPTNAFGGIVGVQTGDGIAPTFGPVLGGAGGAGGFRQLMLCSANIPDKIASAVDVQLDDGVRTTGTLRGMLQTTLNPTIVADATEPAAGGTASYVETGTNAYTVCGLIEAP